MYLEGEGERFGGGGGGGGGRVEECYMHVSKSLISDFGVQSNLLRRTSLKVELTC